MSSREPRGPAAGEAAGRVTPMMEQYIEIRAANPDCLLFYRMGDFYELFFGDAVTASRALGIALTKRGKHLGEDIAMCGVPVHAADDYLQKLIALGHRVAVCEQTEDPAEARKRGGKSVVRRQVTRLITPGTLTEDRHLEPGRNNFLAAIVRVPGSADAASHAIAWTDISTGEFFIGEARPGGLAAFLARVEPREALIAERLAEDAEIRTAFNLVGCAVTPLPPAFFDAMAAEARLCGLFAVKTMQAFGDFSRAELAAGAALVAYVEKTQLAQRPPLSPPKRIGGSEVMHLDAATRANLELFRTLSGARAGSLIAAIDRTRTAGGSRLLAERLANPSCDFRIADERLGAVTFFVERQALCTTIRDRLAEAPDLLRALSRLALDRGGPRDLDCMRLGLEAARDVAHHLEHTEEIGADRVDMPPSLPAAAIPIALAETLRQTLAEELPTFKRDGDFVRPGVNAELDEARSLRDESRRIIASLQSRYAEATGIRTLKIRHNNVLGFFIEVGVNQAQALLQAPADEGETRFIHRQTMAGAMRFTTAELGELERKIASAADRALLIELGVFDMLAAQVAAADAAIRAMARWLAEVDVAAALATLAIGETFVRPKVDGSLVFEIDGGRHPVVEQALARDGRGFVGNDCDLGPSGEGEQGRIWLITGPNMAGKSTFLRQNALIAILAQMGSYVPARSAHIGVVDAVFSRVGAADDLARGRSTFMVEMVETAAILNQAGRRALVILDEIGRGTATFDGLSIAWAAIEHLHETNGCRALFATHYHELTALSAKLRRLHNATMKVKEWKGDVVFLHEIVAGVADRSYGIQVAKLAGLPASVIARAREVLESLERSDRSRPKAMIDDLPLFAARSAEPAREPHPALAALEALNPDELSPKEALSRLYELKRLRPGNEE